MRFAMSYSCGKDSTLALHKMLLAGHEPVCLLTMFNEQQQRSWFHGADTTMLSAYGEALGLPLLSYPADGPQYAEVFEQALAEAKALGAEACSFGDIDLEQNRRWEEDRCQKLEIKPFFPLWNMKREDILGDLLGSGYRCVIKAINKEKFSRAGQEEVDDLCESYLGKFLDNSFLQAIKSLGGDICGENGEYHTLVVDGPIFRRPLPLHIGRIMQLPGHAIVETACD